VKYTSGDLHIPEGEFKFVYSRARGPGGQNVNKVSTKVTLLFDVTASPSLSAAQKQKIASRLTTRISKNGVLRIVAMRYRTQKANKEDAVRRFFSLLDIVLRQTPRRRKTKISTAAREKRMQEKRHRGKLKQTRQKIM